MTTNTDDDLEALFDAVAAGRELSDSVTITKPGAGAPDQGGAVPSPDRAADLAAAPAETPHLQPGRDASEKEVFDRLGGIVRQMHNSIRELGYDKELSDSAKSINDAQDRLAYIAELTEKSANTVLNTIDDGMPAQDAIIAAGNAMQARWDALLSGSMSLSEFKALAADSRAFAAKAVTDAEAEKARLLAIMMAQDFQDITGQIIKKVIVVTKKVEFDLAQLLLDSAPADMKEKLVKSQDKPVDLLAGPAVPAIAMAQDDVDDLLAGLGF